LLASEFIRRGYRVDFLLLNSEGELLGQVPDDARVVELGVKRFRNALMPIVQYIHQERPIAILAAMWPLTGVVILAKVIARFSGRVIVGEHTNLSRDPSISALPAFVHIRFGRHIYLRSNGVVAVSHGVKESLSQRTGLNPDTVAVIHNPVRALDPSVRADPFIAGWLGSGRVTIIAVGSLKAAKDFPSLIAAFARLRHVRKAQLLILGEGSLRGELEAQVESLGLRDFVLMPGFVDDPYPYLAKADLFVLSSAWEGLPGVLIEALVAGVPVVSTDCPSGPAEILENGKYGRLVPVGDPEALAAAMAEALDAPHDRDMLRRRGNEFSVERAADQYLALLDPGGKMLAGT
jgi:glycosyltransferase involved in cell wall biosynthesis